MTSRTALWGLACGLVVLAFAARSVAFADEDRGGSDFDRDVTFLVQNAESADDEHGHWIGVECSESIPDVLRAHINLPAGEGLEVLSVVPDSPAQKAGLAVHDILLKANAKSLRSVSDLVQAVADAGEKPIALEWVHEGNVTKADVAPAKRPGPLSLRPTRRPFRMQFFGPAFQVPDVLIREFPDDLNIEIRKQGSQPAKIKVDKGDQTWDVTEDELDKLPKEVRSFVDQLIGRSFTVGFPRLEGFDKQFDFDATIPAPKDLKLELKRRLPSPPAEIDERLDQLDRRLDRLYDELRQLREAKESKDNAAADEG